MPLVCEAEIPTTRGWISPRGQVALLTCACAGASAFLFAVDPERHAVYPQCLIYNATGLYCAGCGATRALYALLHGRVFQALQDNALFVTTLPIVLGWAGLTLVRTWRKNAWPSWQVEPRLLAVGSAGLFLAMMIFMVLRNLPGWPFALLRPGG